MTTCTIGYMHAYYRCTYNVYTCAFANVHVHVYNIMCMVLTHASTCTFNHLHVCTHTVTGIHYLDVAFLSSEFISSEEGERERESVFVCTCI